MLRALRDRWAMVRRDLGVVAGDLRGRRMPHIVPRTKSARAYKSPERHGPRTRDVIVAAVHRETPAALSVELDTVDGSKLAFEPGQFLTVEVEVDGARLRRAYSLSRAPFEGAPRLTIKRIDGGRVSGFVHDRIRPGARLPVLGPSGNFTLDYDPVRARHVVFIAGGSGITPVRALIAALLRNEPKSRATLVYGNRDRTQVIFDDELRDLDGAHPGRLTVHHVLEDADGTATTGRLDEATLEQLLGNVEADVDRYLVCGPDPVRHAARSVLEGRGIAADRILEEIYVRPELGGEKQAATRPVRVRAKLPGGSTRDFVVTPGETVLEAGLSAGVPLPFSCAMGGCAACKLSLVEGDLVMEEPNCLSGAEREAGAVLACVARPVTDCVIEVAS